MTAVRNALLMTGVVVAVAIQAVVAAQMFVLSTQIGVANERRQEISSNLFGVTSSIDQITEQGDCGLPGFDSNPCARQMLDTVTELRSTVAAGTMLSACGV